MEGLDVSPKYLDNHLGWMRIINTQKEMTPNELLRLVLIVGKKSMAFHH